MNEQYLLDRIIKDAKDEAKKIIGDAKERADGNIAYVKEQAAKKIAEAKEFAQKITEREIDAADCAQKIKQQIETLRQKTKIVDDVFDQAAKEIKFNWKTIQKENYEIRLTREELFGELREEIEGEVVNMLFGEVKR